MQLAGVRQTDSGLSHATKHKYNRIERSATTLYFDLMAYGNIAPTCLSVCLSGSLMDISFVSLWGENGERVLWKEISIKVIFREKMLINLRVVGDVDNVRRFCKCFLWKKHPENATQKHHPKHFIFTILSLWKDARQSFTQSVNKEWKDESAKGNLFISWEIHRKSENVEKKLSKIVKCWKKDVD